MKVTIDQFLADVKVNGPTIAFVLAGNANAVAQHLYNAELLDAYTLLFNDPHAVACAIGLEGLQREDFYFVGEKTRLPFKERYCDPNVPSIWVGCPTKNVGILVLPSK